MPMERLNICQSLNDYKAIHLTTTLYFATNGSLEENTMSEASIVYFSFGNELPKANPISFLIMG